MFVTGGSIEKESYKIYIVNMVIENDNLSTFVYSLDGMIV